MFPLKNGFPKILTKTIFSKGADFCYIVALFINFSKINSFETVSDKIESFEFMTIGLCVNTVNDENEDSS